MHSLGKVGLRYTKFFHAKENATKKRGADVVDGVHRGKGDLTF